MKEFNRFDCECGATILFTRINFIVKEWAKYHKKHMEEILKAHKLPEKYLNIPQKASSSMFVKEEK